MQIQAFACRQPNEPLEPFTYDAENAGQDRAIIKVAGCGVCHTDISFFIGAVKPRHALPLVLGHEISGTVVEAQGKYAHLVGKNVIVPAVMPCGECEVCRAGYENSCKHQFMPGNDGHGGFATHISVPARFLSVLPDKLGGYELADLSVIADAVTTPYQSVVRSGLMEGDFAVVVGSGGIGTYAVQIARALGARVLAVDIDQGKLDTLKDHGAAATLCTQGMDASTARKAVRDTAKAAGAPAFGWKIFEMSGSAAGQELAFNIIPPSGTLAIVGFTMEAVKIRLSNLMALDARCFGNWGCAPQFYGPAIRMVLDGRITLRPFIERFPLSQINKVFELAHHGKLAKRAVMVPS